MASDKDGFISSNLELDDAAFKNLYNELKSARSARGWRTENIVVPDENSEITDEVMTNIKNAAMTDNIYPRYESKSFPSYNANEGLETLYNFFNEIKLNINDTKNLVGCNTGCSGSCYTGCSGSCKTECSGTCANSCGGSCASGCTYNCGSMCRSLSYN